MKTIPFRSEEHPEIIEIGTNDACFINLAAYEVPEDSEGWAEFAEDGAADVCCAAAPENAAPRMSEKEWYIEKICRELRKANLRQLRHIKVFAEAMING